MVFSVNSKYYKNIVESMLTVELCPNKLSNIMLPVKILKIWILKIPSPCSKDKKRKIRKKEEKEPEKKCLKEPEVKEEIKDLPN